MTSAYIEYAKHCIGLDHKEPDAGATANYIIVRIGTTTMQAEKTVRSGM